MPLVHEPLTPSAPRASRWGSTDLPPPPARGLVALGRHPPAWGLGSVGLAEERARGRQGARGGRGPKPRSQGPQRPCSGRPAPSQLTEPPSRCARWSSGLRQAGAGAPGAGPGGRGSGPPAPGSRSAGAWCPASARCAPRPGSVWGGPGWCRSAAAARELCRRLAPVRSSCSSFPGNFRPGIPPPGGRAAPPAQPAAQVPPQGCGGAGRARRHRPLTRHRSWASGLRKQVRPPWRTSPGIGGCGDRGGPRRRPGSEGAARQ